MDINNIKMVGIDKDASLEIREKAYIKDIISALKYFKSIGLEEVVILSTCNRTEVYFYSEIFTIEEIKKYFIDYFSLEENDLKFIKEFYGIMAVLHLFRVSCGLESMVVGEDQILAQVKESISIAQQCNTAGKLFFKLFREAVTLGKRVRTETGIKDLALSISYIAIKFVQKVFGNIEGKKAFVIGTGEMGQKAIKNLIDKGAAVYITNRTISKAYTIKKEFTQITVVPYEEKYKHITDSQIVISATNAPHYTINKEKFKDVFRGQKICMIDIAVPRDIDPEISSFKGVYLYTIDDLKKTAEENQKERDFIVKIIEKRIEEEIYEFQKWFDSLKIEKDIIKINEYAFEVYNSEYERIKNKLNILSEKDKINIKTALKRVAEKMANRMISDLKENI